MVRSSSPAPPGTSESTPDGRTQVAGRSRRSVQGEGQARQRWATVCSCHSLSTQRQQRRRQKTQYDCSCTSGLCDWSLRAVPSYVIPFSAGVLASFWASTCSTRTAASCGAEYYRAFLGYLHLGWLLLIVFSLNRCDAEMIVSLTPRVAGCFAAPYRPFESEFSAWIHSRSKSSNPLCQQDHQSMRQSGLSFHSATIPQVRFYLLRFGRPRQVSDYSRLPIRPAASGACVVGESVR